MFILSAVPGKIFIDIITKEEEDVQAHFAMLDDLTIAVEVLEITYEYEFEENYRIDAFLSFCTIV